MKLRTTHRNFSPATI